MALNRGLAEALQARTIDELHLAALKPLDEAIPELYEAGGISRENPTKHQARVAEWQTHRI